MPKESIQRAAQLVRAGQHAEARKLALSVLAQNPQNVPALWMLANLAESEKEQYDALTRLLNVRPDHEQAKAMIKKLEIEDKAAAPPVTKPKVSPVLDDFKQKLRKLISEVPRRSEHIAGNEEATKNALIMPLINNVLGFNVFNPTEVIPEFTADVGTKRGEKVDYAILRDGRPIVLIECKAYGVTLTDEHAAQLFRYYSVCEARFGILTNGIDYRFYTDLEEPNKMDQTPFSEINLLDLTEECISLLAHFSKSMFNVDEIVSTASDLKYTREIKNILAAEFIEPDENFVRFFAAQVYPGRVTQSVRDQFYLYTRKAFKQFVQEQLMQALSGGYEVVDEVEEDTNGRQIETTVEEREAYFIVKSLLRETVDDVRRVAIRDYLSFCAVLLDDNRRKPVCHLYFNNPRSKSVVLFDGGKQEKRVAIDDVDDLYKYANYFKAVVRYYDQP